MYSGLFKSEGEERSWFAEGWGWYIVLEEVSNLRKNTWEEVLSFPTRELLNMMAYLKDKGKYQKEQIKKVKRQ